METLGSNYLDSVIKLFRYYKELADRAVAGLSDEQLNWLYNEQSNSIATIMKHIAGNSISRWTDFMNSDGEKPNRDRDGEFEHTAMDKAVLLEFWRKGWQCLFDAVSALTDADLLHIIYIRNEAHTVTQAINRQLAHLPYHVGQIVFVAKMLSGDEWRSLTIPKKTRI
ncbi:uncharacterized protein DUF1572 [Mucilaginibacter yixingensis]|uniref:Uncharacterized protein DUF1572 n=1 Tax=Mucilaginibacter yixingensis TaxID=1295612 RepID=A0A2T5J7Q3_9SPHI|nr:DUF1572 family protein [Mucilaginibacter yixingensis]PTQ95182.1 uncharacterized protein DUF1572 [Mucilaginibacter yixingensis]